MGTVSQETECQRCGYEHGYHEFQTKTGEQYFMCRRCGHQVRYVIDNLDKRKFKSGKKKGEVKKTKKEEREWVTKLRDTGVFTEEELTQIAGLDS